MRLKRRSKGFRNGGRQAMKMPTESSAELQMVRSMPSHVGSWVLVMTFNSMVLKMEHTVPLNTPVSTRCRLEMVGDLHDTEQKHCAQSPLRSLR